MRTFEFAVRGEWVHTTEFGKPVRRVSVAGHAGTVYQRGRVFDWEVWHPGHAVDGGNGFESWDEAQEAVETAIMQAAGAVESAPVSNRKKS